MVNLNETTTISIMKEDKEYVDQKIPGKTDKEKIHEMLDFYKRNYDRPNIEVWATELNKELDKGNQKIYDLMEKAFHRSKTRLKNAA